MGISKEHMEASEDLEEAIIKLIMESPLSYWETLGMLEHIKQEVHRIGYIWGVHHKDYVHITEALQ